MASLLSSVRVKVKGDTYFLPDANGGGVYFRNNERSFQLQGSTIFQWTEKVIPLFDGTQTLKELTEGLSYARRQRVYLIAEVLLANGFARDVSQDSPHQLTEEILEQHAAQIEFLDNVAGSGAYRFQTYRQAKVLAVGAGPFFVALVGALLESGLQQPHLLITNSESTDRQRLTALETYAKKKDSLTALTEVEPPTEGEISWQEIVQPFDWILYVSQTGDVTELRALHGACRAEQKGFLPAICVEQVGMAGPLVHPDSYGCWESVWRRVHQTALCKDPQHHAFSSTAGAMLANVIVFDLMHSVAGVTEPRWNRNFFLLNLETLEGNWNAFLPHPAVVGLEPIEPIEDVEELLENDLGYEKGLSIDMFSYFNLLTSKESGIFETWAEGDLEQLPLALCRVQAADPKSAGPAELLPEIVCAGLTHEEARLEAGLRGIETYVSRWVELEGVGVGAGVTVSEAVSRGLQQCLEEELHKRQGTQPLTVRRVELSSIEDERCQYYVQALTTMRGAPTFGLGHEVWGLPVVWVCSDGIWHGNVGLNLTRALRSSLQQALLQAQDAAAYLTTGALAVSSAQVEEEDPQQLVIPSCEKGMQKVILQTALQVLHENRQQLTLSNLALEPFLNGELAGVFGVSLREEESR